MDYAAKSTAELEQIVATAKAELEKGRAEGRSEMSTVMRTRYRVLGAAVAALAGRRTGGHMDEKHAPQTDDLAAIEQWRENQEMKKEPTTTGCTGCIPANGQAPEGHVAFAHSDCPVHGVVSPTTAEAFATVRMQLREELFPYLAQNGGASLKECEERAEAALALLERRMGAQARSAEALFRCLLADLDDVSEPTRLSPETHFALNRLQKALVGAPPVFTLEEVREAMLRTGADADSIQEGCAHLAALRR